MRSYHSLFLLIITILLISCDEQQIKKTYYKSNKIKEILYLSNDKYDSIHTFYDTSENSIKSKSFYDSSSVFFEAYYKNGKLFRSGEFLSEGGQKIGEWKYYNSEGYLSDIREYLNVKNKIILNQIKYFNGLGEVIRIGSNSFNTYNQEEFKKEELNDKRTRCISVTSSKDTISIDEPFKAVLYYFSTLYDKPNNYIKVFIDDEETVLNEDFSNAENLNLYEFSSLSKDSFNQKWYPDDEKDYNSMSVFGSYYKKSGKKVMKGYIEEIVADTVDNNINETVINKIYFKIPIYVEKTDDVR